MTFGATPHRGKPWWLYLTLTLVLLACLWVGWRDFDLWVPQDEIRESIRSSIRRLIQVLIQYVIPAAIIIFFAKSVVAKLRGSA